ncbi:hypothetical protein RCZ04_00200 [Capnocytophaga sp. HP1101]
MLCAVGLRAQTATRTTTQTTIALPEKQEAPVYKQRYGLRVGADLSKLVHPFFDKDYYGLELVGDYRLSYNYYLAAELGHEKRTKEEDFYTYTTEGQFLRAGFDYNTYGNWYGMENMIYVGARYGISLFSQDLTAYTIHKNNQYWNENILGSDPSFLKKYDGRTAHWLELVVGIKAELLRNLYAGASVRVGLLAVQTGNSGFPNYYIPAFGRVHEDSRWGINFNYTLSYLIPLYKKEKKKEEATAKTEASSPTPSVPAKKPKGRR